MANSTRSAREIDVHIGNRVRTARKSRHISQTALADALGITFQQLQKYENGSNRISAGRLYETAHVLRLPIAYFFEGAKAPRTASEKRRNGRMDAARKVREAR